MTYDPLDLRCIRLDAELSARAEAERRAELEDDVDIQYLESTVNIETDPDEITWNSTCNDGDEYNTLRNAGIPEGIARRVSHV